MLDEKAFFATINQVVTLSLRTYGMTVKIYCEKQKAQSLIRKRKALTDAHSRKAITLPEHIGKWKTGMTKRYQVSDLIQNWPDYCAKISFLPKLKPQYR